MWSHVEKMILQLCQVKNDSVFNITDVSHYFYIFLQECCHVSANPFSMLSKNSWPQTLCILRYKLCVLAEPEPMFGRYFSSPFIKNYRSFGNSEKPSIPFSPTVGARFCC